jgi:uncharacterized protein (TIGR03437 family)
MLKLRRLTPIFVAALGLPLGAQVFDNTGNNLLNGTYYFREVIYNLNTQLYAVAYGNISFTGTGSYSISGAMEGDTNSGQLSPFQPPNGTYTISASGYGFISNQILGGSTYGMVSNGIFVGSTTESGYNDLFIAAPVNGQSTSTLQGSYTMAYIHPLVPVDAVLQMSANGGGTIGTVNVSAYQTSSTPTNQSISGVKYIVSNNAFVVTYPNSSSNLITGAEYLYSTPDGSFVFGGNPEDFDMVVGVRNGSTGNNFGGLYYAAGLDEDVSQLASGSVGLDTYYGSFNASNGIVVGHERLQSDSSAYGYTFDDSYPQGTNGSYMDAFTSSQYIGGNGGAVRIGVGIGPSLSLSVALQAPTFGGSGVYLNPAGVVNAASNAPFTAGLSPGEFITLYGTNLGPSTLQFASTVPFPIKLGGVQVLINNSPVPIYYVSANQISAIVPFEITSAVAQVQVTYNGATSNAVTELVNLTTPGVFTNDPVGGIGYSAALHPDYSLVTPESPAQVGETIAVYMTGLGTVFPSVADGAAAPGTTTTSNAITADISGTAANVTYMGLAPGYVGLYQLNVQIPSGVTAGDNYLDISGPDSYASEALISIGSTGLSAQARPTRPAVLHRRNSSLHPLQRKTLRSIQ